MEMAFQKGFAFVLWVAMCGIAALPAAAEPGRLLNAKPMDDAPSGARAWRITALPPASPFTAGMRWPARSKSIRIPCTRKISRTR